ncbi:protein Niban 1-like isoform X1 [Scyliorhinus torazame]|uniref:protein Niban 1-like isoform X1 n=1 Tax=Scyliorhinus torazame TaxID=75743 RepID=UPI003B5BA7D5
MGGSVSSLDENRCNYIRGKAEAELKNFSPHYQRQYSVAFFNHIRCEVEQDQEEHPQLLQHKEPKGTGKVVHKQEVTQYVEELKKWKDRHIVIKNDNSIECYENKEVHQKGGDPKYKLIPTGYRVLTSMIEYALLVDKYFPDPSAANGKDGNQSFLVNHTQYPVYLWHPYRKHSYFCFENEEVQQGFGAVLNDCIRHLNYEFAKQSSFEVQAFAEAIQFFRQEKGHYGSWEMNHGNEALILSNLVMEELLPSLQSDILPKMKGKKNEKRKTWFSILEDAYILVQNQLAGGFQSLQDGCKISNKELEGIIRSDMDQIITSKEFTAGKLKATVSEKADQGWLENIQPHLASISEELIGLISSGFAKVRSLFENEVNELSAKCQNAGDVEKLKEYLDQLMNLPFNAVKMQPCYNKVSPLQDQIQELKNRFKFTNTQWLIQTTQNFMQELMDNAVYTFEKLLSDSLKNNPSKTVTSIEKVKQRVLKQYDHDSSTVRKKLFQEALVQITLPTLQKALAPSYKRELQKFEQYIFADYTKLIQVENIYEEILLHTILREVVKVVNEAAILKKHNLFEDNTTYTSDSDSNLTDKNEGKTPPDSQSRSPAKTSSEGSYAEGLETGEKVTSQISTLSSDPTLNEKQECEQSSVSQVESSDELLHATLDSKQNGEVITQVNTSTVQETNPAVINYQEAENLTKLNNKNSNENTSRNECQNKEVEIQKEGITPPPPDSLKEIHDLLTVAVVPAEEGPENQEALLPKDECQKEVHKESSQKVDEYLKDADERKKEDVSLATEPVESQSEENKESKVEDLPAPLEELAESHVVEDNEPKASPLTVVERMVGQAEDHDEPKGSPSTVEELVEGQAEEDNEPKCSQSTIVELVESQGKEDNEPKGSPSTVEERVESQGKEDNEPKGSPPTVEELVEGQAEEDNEPKGSPPTVEELVEGQAEEDNEPKGSPPTVEEFAESQGGEDNEPKCSQSTIVDRVEGWGKEDKESVETLPAMANELVESQDEKAAEPDKEQMPLKIDECLENVSCIDNIESNHVSGSAAVLHKEGIQEVSTIHTTDMEISLVFSEKEKEQKTLNQDKAKEGDENSPM